MLFALRVRDRKLCVLVFCRDSIKSVFVQAVVLCLSQSFVFYLYAAGFSFGAFLVVEGRAVYEDVFQSV